jgi:hypothetical protein
VHAFCQNGRFYATSGAANWTDFRRGLPGLRAGDPPTMLRQGPISLTLHAALEPLVAALLIAAPFLFGFSDKGAPTAVSIVAGIAVLVIGMSTDWRLSLIRAIPVPAHLAIDLGMAALLIAAPFLFGYSDQSAPTAFSIVVGVGLLLAVLGTRWYPAAGNGGTPQGGRRFGRRRNRETSAVPTDSQPTG